jgi:hypothetical protein
MPSIREKRSSSLPKQTGQCSRSDQFAARVQQS